MGQKVKSAIISEKNMIFCYCCSYPYVEIHHIFHAFARNASDRYGYIVPLCHRCHMALHDGKEDELDLHLKQLAQVHFEEHHGTRDEFIQIFGRSYL